MLTLQSNNQHMRQYHDVQLHPHHLNNYIQLQYNLHRLFVLYYQQHHHLFLLMIFAKQQFQLNLILQSNNQHTHDLKLHHHHLNNYIQLQYNLHRLFVQYQQQILDYFHLMIFAILLLQLKIILQSKNHQKNYDLKLHLHYLMHCIPQ